MKFSQIDVNKPAYLVQYHVSFSGNTTSWEKLSYKYIWYIERPSVLNDSLFQVNLPAGIREVARNIPRPHFWRGVTYQTTTERERIISIFGGPNWKVGIIHGYTPNYEWYQTEDDIAKIAVDLL